MSQYTEIMEELAAIREQNDWLVSALKHLLGREAGGQPEVDELELDDEADFEFTAVRTRPQPKAKVCPHNQQGIVDGRLTCLRCGFNFTETGSVQNRVGPNGQIVRDPNPPGWALEHSPGASSKNPGTPLVPHEV